MNTAQFATKLFKFTWKEGYINTNDQIHDLSWMSDLLGFSQNDRESASKLRIGESANLPKVSNPLTVTRIL